MKKLKLILLKLIPSQTREEGDFTITFKILFGKMHITSKHLLRRDVLHLNKSLMNAYMEKISA